MKLNRVFFLLVIIPFLISACYQPGPGSKPWQVSGLDDVKGEKTTPTLTKIPNLEEINLEEVAIATPTPNPPIVLPTPRSETLQYTVRSGDTLKKIALNYQVSINALVFANDIVNPDLIEVGQVLLIPPPSYEATTSGFKIIPDSELINSPSNADFDVKAFVESLDGYLNAYVEEVDGVNYSGAQVLARVALEYSVNPRLLLAILEYQSGWVTSKDPAQETINYPLRYFDPYRQGLYKQLSWASNLLNEGYYLWKINAISIWILSDSTVIGVDPTINPGTAGVLNLLRYLTDQSEWERAVSENGFFATFFRFFGYPFTYAYEPMIPEDLSQPTLQLPFESEVVWSFTGGPHGGWNTGSAWAAIDFAPPGEALGCYASDAWVVASASGQIVYSDHGAVIQDLDGDGIWQTGWSILYMHIDSWQRVEVGTMLEAGDRIGHPSCEGGFSTGTHLHLARRYNGEWIAADADLPLVLDGWVSVGYGVEYDGYLVNGEITLEAWNGRSSLNAIKR